MKLINFILKKQIINFRFLYFLIFLLFFQNTLYVKSDLENTKFDNSINTKISLLEENYYLIDSGDVIKINFLSAEELNNDYLVMSDGYIYLPFVKPVFLRGLTIQEARNKIEEVFSEELLVPNVNVGISQRRPLKISIIGEVQKPGLHILKSNENLSKEKQFEMKTVLDAIQQAGGITQEANLRNVELIRKLPGPEASFKTTQLDLADLILNGNQVFNIYLFDGDILKIKKAATYKEEIVKLSQSTIAPSEIKVNVIGKVNNPGQISLKPNSSFTQAVMRAGGVKALEANRNNIQLIRINSNGTMTSRRFYYNESKQISKKDNPLLIDGDIIIVNPSSFQKISTGVGFITKPLSGLVTAISVFKLLD